MFIKEGDTVILVATEEPNLRHYIGLEWKVRAVIFTYHPASAIIVRDNLQASCYIKQLEVVPPDHCPFGHNELVSIKKEIPKASSWAAPYHFHTELLGKVGHVRGYDSRNEYLLIRATSGGAGWFPVQALLPLDYKGERFFYPLETVLYKNKEHVISRIKKSRFKWGQLLLIDGEWVPSTDVEPLP